MPERMTRTEKWGDPWFRKLKPAQKLLWLWMLDNCDIAGVVDIDIEKVHFETLAKGELNEDFDGRVIPLSGTRYWIRGFIEFHQKCGMDQLNPENRFHKAILRKIEQYGLFDLSGRGLEGATKGLASPPTHTHIISTQDKTTTKADATFAAPTLEEVEAYMESVMQPLAKRCPGITKLVFPKQEAPQFVGYYTQRDWMVKGKRMKSWQQAAYNWLIKSYQFKQEKAR